MKNLFFIVSLLLCVGSTMAQDDMGWVREMYTGCYFHTNPGARFTWSGGCKDGYCSGYGTIQWYDDDGTKSTKFVGDLVGGKAEGYAIQYHSNGNRAYDGYWRNDMENGRGTKYNYDGSIAYSGNFVNGDLAGIAPLNYFASQAGQLIMQKVFDGGVDLRTNIIKLGDGEVRVRITFHGNYVWENFYGLTLVVRNYSPYVAFVDVNDNATVYATLKGAAMVADAIHEMYESSSSNN